VASTGWVMMGAQRPQGGEGEARGGGEAGSARGVAPNSCCCFAARGGVCGRVCVQPSLVVAQGGYKSTRSVCRGAAGAMCGGEGGQGGRWRSCCF